MEYVSKSSSWYSDSTPNIKEFDYDAIDEKCNVGSNFPFYVMASLLFAFGASVAERHRALYVVSAVFLVFAFFSFINVELEIKDYFKAEGWYERYSVSWHFGRSAMKVFGGLIAQFGMTLFAAFGIRY
jgi:hypothetical protein